MLSYQAFIIDVPTIFAWDTDDSTEETRSGKRTAHITGGIIIQREQSITTEMIWHGHDPSQDHQLKKMLCKIRKLRKTII